MTINVTPQLGKLLNNIANKTPQRMITQAAIGKARETSVQEFQYDFIGLATKLIVYFAVAMIFTKFMEAVILARGAWVTIANLFGMNLPKSEQVPDSLKKLFTEGYHSFKFWDLVKIGAVLIVIAEYMRYAKMNPDNKSPMTVGIFILIIAFLGVTTIPELYQRFKKTDLSLESMR